MDRHYIPRIEEFYVGFDYEIRDWWTNQGTPGIPPTATLEEREKILSEYEKNKIPDGFTNQTLSENHLHEWRYWDMQKRDGVQGSPGCDYRHEWERITTGIKDGTVRVKYLTRDDIADLGFTHLGSGWFEKDNYRIRKWVDNEIDVYLWDQDKELGYGEIIFSGIIKNKSELKQLLKQLKIQ